MQMFLRSSTVVLVFVMVTFGGSGFAQPTFPDALLESEWAASVFVVFDDAFATDGGARELGSLLISTMRRGAGVSSDAPTMPSTCATVLGAGSHPKLDGGGNLLAALPGGVHPQGYVVDPAELAVGLVPQVDTIVIADDFQLDVLGASIASTTLRMDAGDALQQLWNALVHVPGAGDVATVAVPHGHFVAYHALAHLGATHAEVTIDTNVAIDGVLGLTVEFDDGRIVQVRLVAITFDDPSSMGIVKDTLSDFDQANAVVVTSWGLVDCALGAGYGEAMIEGGAPGNATFAHYLKNALASGDAEAVLISLCSTFEDRINQAIAPASIDCSGDIDALLDLGTIAAIAAMSVQAAEDVGMRPEGDWVQVTSGIFASAGNQGLPFPMPPAAWPGVIGVEACMRGVPERAGFSNKGWLGLGAQNGDQAVRALGTWFATSETSDGNDGAPEGTPLGYWGTSFAAPAAAMYYAAGSFTLVNDLEILDPCERP